VADVGHPSWPGGDVDVPWGPMEHRSYYRGVFRWHDPRPWHEQVGPHLDIRAPKRELTEQERDAVRSILAGESAEEWCRRWGVHPDG
jgi:hypothetical protein